MVAGNVPIFVVTLARPELLERRPDWGAGQRNFTSLFLEPLAEAAMRELLAGPGARAARSRRCGRSSRGRRASRCTPSRPCGCWSPTGASRPSGDGTYVPAGDLTELAVPGTLTALIAARLDALDPADRALVLDAAVLGQSFTLAALAAVAGHARGRARGRGSGASSAASSSTLEADPRSARSAASTRSCRRSSARSPTTRSRSRTARAATSPPRATSRRSATTSSRARWRATTSRPTRAGRRGPEEEALAAQARIALRAAAERAAALGAHDQAVAFFNQAISVVTDPAEHAELLERAGEEASIAARPEDAELYLREAVRMHREHSDKAALARAGARLGRALLTVYHTDAALEVLTQIGADIAELRETPDGIAIDMQLARTHWLRDEPRLALQIADRVLGLAERLDLVAIVAEMMSTRGGALNDMGQTYEGIAVMEGALRLADQHGLTSIALRGRSSLAGYLIAREPQAAVQLLVTGAAEARRLGYRANLIRLLSNAAGAWVETGEWALARREMEELLAGPLGREDRLFALSAVVLPKVFTGEDCADELREMDAALEGERDGNVLNVGVGTWGLVHLAEGQYPAAIAEMTEAARLSPFNAPGALSYAGHAAT